ncbi:hypothetical protein CPB83DRAFT_851206 [Crepidotus variabilis]|uniref:Uncharacterized protein n=1 Tax=Crepidotus variabilis TaxID=179855 RepID=A0A9P6JRT5_9AGAR|nr:hypothetical protein CPB83DRAFT_851206 [Crepidotus variabilis]
MNETGSWTMLFYQKLNYLIIILQFMSLHLAFSPSILCGELSPSFCLITSPFVLEHPTVTTANASSALQNVLKLPGLAS